MSKPPKVETVYNDLVGKPLEIGAPVAYSEGNILRVGFIEKFTPKMVKVVKSKVKTRKWGSTSVAKYPNDLVMLDPKLVTLYLLKN